MKKSLLLLLLAFTFSLLVPEAGAAPASVVVPKVTGVNHAKHHKHRHHRRHRHHKHPRKLALANALRINRIA